MQAASALAPAATPRPRPIRRGRGILVAGAARGTSRIRPDPDYVPAGTTPGDPRRTLAPGAPGCPRPRPRARRRGTPGRGLPRRARPSVGQHEWRLAPGSARWTTSSPARRTQLQPRRGVRHRLRQAPVSSLAPNHNNSSGLPRPRAFQDRVALHLAKTRKRQQPASAASRARCKQSPPHPRHLGRKGLWQDI